MRFPRELNNSFLPFAFQVKSRLLASTSNAVAVPTTSYQIRVWFSLFFMLLIYFVVYALATVKIEKDSLLYAKFLATDVRQ